jgi:hypothetical protein
MEGSNVAGNGAVGKGAVSNCAVWALDSYIAKRAQNRARILEIFWSSTQKPAKPPRGVSGEGALMRREKRLPCSVDGAS